MNRPTPKFTYFCTRHPVIVVLLILIVTLVLGFFGKDVQRDHSGERMLPEHEPMREYFNSFKEKFDLKDNIIIALYNENGIYTTEMLTLVDRISKDLGGLPFIDRVKSLTTVENITGEQGEVVVKPFIDRIPKTADELADLKKAVDSFPLIRNRLVADDEKSTMIALQPTFYTWENDISQKAFKEIKRQLDEKVVGATYYLTGMPVAIGESNRYMDKDNKTMVPIILGVVVLLLFFSFRNLRGVWIPLAVVVAAVMWTFGAMSLLGIKITIISTSIPVVLVAMGIADGIHIIHEYFHHLRDGCENTEAVHLTMAEMNGPVIMTSLTTAAGFLALGVAEIVPVREYGVAVAFGIIAAMLFSLTFIPACLVLLNKPKRILRQEVAAGGLLFRVSRFLGRIGLHHAKLVILFFLVLLVFSGIVGSRLRADNNVVEFFKHDSAIGIADRFINEHYQGTGSFHFQIDCGQRDCLKDPELLQRISAFQDELGKEPYVGASFSISDVLKRMNFVLHDGDKAYDRVPGSAQDLAAMGGGNPGKAIISQYLLLYEIAGGTDASNSVDSAYQTANIDVSVHSNSSRIYQQIFERVPEIAAATLGPKYTVGRTGSGVINIKLVEYLVMGQIYSLVVSFCVVLLMLVVLFRSFGYALVGAIPLVVTISFNFAFMVLTGIPLNLGTALIASVCIGIGVDYSIHFINRYKIENQRNDNLADAIQSTMVTSGRAILLNALAVSTGFAVLLFSNFKLLIYLGFLIPLIMIVNAVAALVVIPAFLNVFNRRKR